MLAFLELSVSAGDRVLFVRSFLVEWNWREKACHHRQVIGAVLEQQISRKGTYAWHDYAFGRNEAMSSLARCDRRREDNSFCLEHSGSDNPLNNQDAWIFLRSPTY